VGLAFDGDDDFVELEPFDLGDGSALSV